MRKSVVIGAALAGLLIAAAAVPASAGQATHLSDGDYMNAARCAGIAAGLGEDVRPYERTLDVESGGRANFILDAADSARDDGVRLAHRSDAKAKAQVALEHEGVCKAFRS